MSGHSKWATTYRQKAIIDAKRGAIFTKYANLITIAAKKGGDPEANPALRSAIDRAKGVSMPKDNIERAVKRGTGELAGDQVEELYYEAVIPPNIQVVVKAVTDNKNRSGSNIRHIFTKNGGSFAAVLWNFSQQGVIKISSEQIKESKKNIEELELELIDLGMLDISKEDEGAIIYTELEALNSIKDYLQNSGIKYESAEVEYVAKDKIEVSDEDLVKLDKVFAELEDNEDASDFYTNLV